MGYVVKEGGRYLCQRKDHTHTGTHTSTAWTEDLNKATVFYNQQTRRLFNDAEFIEATETRTVTLINKEKMTKYFAITNLITITPLTGCETADEAVDMLSGMFPNAFSLIATKETLVALAENINRALETDEINATTN